MAIKAKQINKEIIINLEMNEKEARRLQELVQNTLYESLEEEPQDITNLRHGIFYAIKNALDGENK